MRLLQALLSVLCLFACAPSFAVDEKDLLPVEQAFVLSARADGPQRIAIEWKIADGYYLYRHRMSAEAGDAGASASALSLPHGTPHTDEFFGRVETFRNVVRGTLDNVSAPGGRISLKVKYQGCADLGICYPPQTRTLIVALTGDSRNDASADSGFAALGRALLGGAQPQPLSGRSDTVPLPPEQAFQFEAIPGDGNTILMRFTPAKGYYLYRERSQFQIEGSTSIQAAQPRWPKGVSHQDEYFGKSVVYFDQADVPLPLHRTAPDAGEVTLIANFQGCQTGGICYPPMTRRIKLSLPAGVMTQPAVPASEAAPDAGAVAGTAEAPVDTANADAAGNEQAGFETTDVPAAAAPADAQEEQAEDTRLAAELAGSGRWLTLLGFFGAGLLLAFTPCVLPMIPILSGLIAGRGERIGAARAFALSLVYVLATAVVFTIAGVVAGLVGANLQVAFQAPWVLMLFAALFVALSLSMFGLYELQLPPGLRNRLGALSDHQRGGSWAGVAAMGALSALIVGPCVAPPLAAAVLYIGQTRDPVFGGAALFVLAMGMGTPLLAFGVAAGRGMPTSGPWMIGIQRVFGFAFIGLAIWMLSRILPAAITLALYGLLAFALAAWLFAQVRGAAHEGGRWALRMAGVMLALVGAVELVGAMTGGRDPLQPLAGAFGTQQQAKLPFRVIKSLDDLDREIAAAKAAGKPLMFDFYADWCVACKEMEKYTFPQPAVHAALDGFVLLKADVTANDVVDQALMKRLGIIGPPATLFYVAGSERRQLRLFGFEKADDFVQRVRRVQP